MAPGEDSKMNDANDEQGDAMNNGLAMAEREWLLRELHRLPDAPPPRDVWLRVKAQAEAEGLLHSRQRPGERRWLLGAGLAAAVVLAVFRLPALLPGGADSGPFPTEPAYVENAGNAALDALMVRSQILENNLRALPAKPRVMRMATAATIDDLEGRIAAIDRALNEPGADLTAAQTEQCWTERGRLMDSLLQLRYAQARRSSM
mgnify:CR=1 FL=1